MYRGNIWHFRVAQIFSSPLAPPSLICLIALLLFPPSSPPSTKLGRLEGEKEKKERGEEEKKEKKKERKKRNDPRGGLFTARSNVFLNVPIKSRKMSLPAFPLSLLFFFFLSR